MVLLRNYRRYFPGKPRGNGEDGKEARVAEDRPLFTRARQAATTAQVREELFVLQLRGERGGRYGGYRRQGQLSFSSTEEKETVEDFIDPATMYCRCRKLENLLKATTDVFTLRCKTHQEGLME